jgi:hypothetical protein
VDRSVSPIPTHGVGDVARETLEEARHEAMISLLAAENLEKQAKAARKQATWKIKQYEKLLQEYNGQLRLPNL